MRDSLHLIFHTRAVAWRGGPRAVFASFYCTAVHRYGTAKAQTAGWPRPRLISQRTVYSRERHYHPNLVNILSRSK